MIENMDKNVNSNEQLIFGKFSLIKQIGEGSFGKVYLGLNKKTQESVAIKLELKSNPVCFLESEALYLFKLKSVGIPQLKAFGRNKTYNILVESLLGESLLNILNRYNKNLPLKDSLMIAIQVIERLEFLHSKYLIHRDIKPANFLIGIDDPYIIYIIDFGLCKKYRSTRTGKHVKFSVTKYYNGTATFASVNALKGIELSRRDDFESAAYMFIYLMKGYLPWEATRGKTKYERFKKIYDIKVSSKPEELCKNLPWEVMEFLRYSKSLDFEQEPDYKYCYSLFNNALKKHGFSNDLIFSWIKKPELKHKLRLIKNKTLLNEGKAKRRKSPQTRIFHFLLNSIGIQKSMQSSKNMDSLENSKENEKPLNSGRSTLNQTLTVSLNNSLNNIVHDKQEILTSKLGNHKNYRRICLEPVKKLTDPSIKKPSVNISLNTARSNKSINRKNGLKIKKDIKIPILNLNANYISRNMNKRMTINKNYIKENSKVLTQKNLVNKFSMNPINNINSKKIINNYINDNIKNNLSAIISLNNIKKVNQNGNTNYIRIIQNNNINSRINMIINMDNPIDEKQNYRKILLENRRPNINLNLKNEFIKNKIEKKSHKKIFVKKEKINNKNNNNFIKIGFNTYQNSNTNTINNTKRNETKYYNISEKNSFRDLENNYKKFLNKRNRIDIKDYFPSFQKSKSIIENNLNPNFFQLFNKTFNQNYINENLGNKIKHDINITNKNSSTNSKLVEKLKKNILSKRKLKGNILNNDFSNHNLNKNKFPKLKNKNYLSIMNKMENNSRTLDNSKRYHKKINEFL